jgi:hypothetical protein
MKVTVFIVLIIENIPLRYRNPFVSQPRIFFRPFRLPSPRGTPLFINAGIDGLKRLAEPKICLWVL